jgi:hypothetical protein
LEERRKIRVNHKSSLNQQEGTKTPDPAIENKPKWKAKYPCLICAEDHYTQDFPCRDEVNQFMKGGPQPVVLTNPFPPQQQQMVSQNPAPLQEGNAGHPPQGDASSSAHQPEQVFMFKMIDLTNRAKNYDVVPDNTTPGGDNDKASTSFVSPPLSDSLQIENPTFDSVFSHRRVQFVSWILIPMLVSLRIIILLRIWHKHLAPC